jgi:NAD-dependent SIR2 family protein deacetylase
MSTESPGGIEAARQGLGVADALLISAGAGMGVDSGLPDFRGPEGFWRAYPAIAKRGLSFAAAANPEWFDCEPEFAWAFYGHRLNLYRATAPHEGFGRLLKLAKEMPLGAFVFTSNVDGHFQKAGFEADRVFEVHGSIHHLQCSAPCSAGIWAVAGEGVDVDEEAFRARGPLPECSRCGGTARPNILMFGDARWIADRSDAQEDRYRAWCDSLVAAGAKTVVLEFGAGTAIPTVRLESEAFARRTGGLLVRVNPREPEVPRGQIGIPSGALEAIRKLAGGPRLRF